MFFCNSQLDLAFDQTTLTILVGQTRLNAGSAEAHELQLRILMAIAALFILVIGSIVIIWLIGRYIRNLTMESPKYAGSKFSEFGNHDWVKIEKEKRIRQEKVTGTKTTQRPADH